MKKSYHRPQPRNDLSDTESCETFKVMTDTEETGLLKRLEAFMSKGKNTTALSIEKDGGGYSVRSSLINPPKAKSLGEAIDNFLKNAESERS